MPQSCHPRLLATITLMRLLPLSCHATALVAIALLPFLSLMSRRRCVCRRCRANALERDHCECGNDQRGPGTASATVTVAPPRPSIRLHWSWSPAQRAHGRDRRAAGAFFSGVQMPRLSYRVHQRSSASRGRRQDERGHDSRAVAFSAVVPSRLPSRGH